MPTKKTILVTGGAGFIGSHMVDMLGKSGYQVIVLDNLTTGHQDAVLGAKLIVGDLANVELLKQIFSSQPIDAVMHFAASIEVGESVLNPAKYYQNNVVNSLNLLQVMVQFGVKHLVYSSSAAVYGEPQQTPLEENHPKMPVNPYGLGKWIVEKVLADFERAYDLRSISLRYFNAAGADPEGRLGERHEPESHLIPLLLQIAAGKRQSITIFGDDYPTLDGTCVRDYVHVTDLCTAHLLALEALFQGANTTAYNLGNGQGYSVKQVIEAVRLVTKHPIPVVQGARRPGDPASLVANAQRAMTELSWQPRYPDLANIVGHSWRFLSQNAG